MGWVIYRQDALCYVCRGTWAVPRSPLVHCDYAAPVGHSVTNPSNVLSVAGLRKVYGDIVAVDEVSFTVQRNEIVGLLGPNGAGKTTTINMILSVLEPTSGTIHIEGLDLARRRRQALERTNFAAVYAPLPGNLTQYKNRGILG